MPAPEKPPPEGPVQGLGYAKPVKDHSYLRLSEDGAATERAPIAEEVPVAFVYAGRPHVVMLSTPLDLEDFAVGFTISEEICGGAAEIGAIDVVRHSRGIELQIAIPAGAAERLSARTRALAGRTGCGICGVEAIDDAVRAPRAVRSSLAIDAAALWRAEEALDARQPYNRATRTVHAAAWATAAGELQVVREDVGRHNALDKVIGALARAGTDPSGGFFLVTSRASFELVQKSAVAGVPLLAAVSRPTSLAIRLADAAGITLAGLLRSRSANIYTHPERVRFGAPLP
ncbi:MAG: formate dehydrogenase accessory sulfurtransferase FdhD [Planctomycetes bacterium]|nr:formate dehydrogenase accessory sulfurtransferase FdhD [Planctomycetota bacterium]